MAKTITPGSYAFQVTEDQEAALINELTGQRVQITGMASSTLAPGLYLTTLTFPVEFVAGDNLLKYGDWQKVPDPTDEHGEVYKLEITSKLGWGAVLFGIVGIGATLWAAAKRGR